MVSLIHCQCYYLHVVYGFCCVIQANKILLAFHRIVSIVLERRKLSPAGDNFNETSRNLQQITNELGI